MISMIANTPLIAVIAATLLAVAVGNVWRHFGDSRATSPHEGEANETLQATVWSIALYLLFFFAAALFLPLVRMGYFSFMQLALLLVLLLCAGDTRLHQITLFTRSYRYAVAHIVHTLILVFGGLAVIHYWPW